MTVKVGDLAYVRMQAADPDKAERFLLDFGLQPAGREGERRYFRASDPSLFCYVLEPGENRFLGFAFQAAGADDLAQLAEEQGAAIEPNDLLGGGERVRLREPNGYAVDVVHGMTPGDAIPVARQLLNLGAQRLQRTEPFRHKKGAATVLKRLAHVVLATPRAKETIAWFELTLGLISSDRVVAGPERHTVGAFMRIDAGEEYVDHHTIFVISGETAGLHHISFESQDVDAVLADHHHLKGLGYEHMWGIGRHTLGSQIFDYWVGPTGHLHEHWADTDRFNASSPTGEWDVREGMVTQWGDETPARVRAAARP